MKFAQYLNCQCVQEWKSGYIDYVALKKWIRSVTDGNKKDIENGLESGSNKNLCKSFETKIDSEVARVNDFFHRQELNARIRLDSLLHSIKTSPMMSNSDRKSIFRRSSSLSISKSSSAEDIESLDLDRDRITPEFLTDEFLDAWNSDVSASTKAKFKNSLLEYYRSMEMLINFKTLNVTGFFKITKKFDRYTNSTCQGDIMASIMRSQWIKSQFAENTALSVENLFALLFCASDKARALNVLRLQKPPSDSDYSIGYRVGFFLGLSFIFMILIIRDLCVWKLNESKLHHEYQLKVVLPFFLPIIMLWGMVINLWMWRSFGINYPYIFGFNPKKYLNIHQVMDIVSVFTAIWSCGCWLFIDQDFSDTISPGQQPFLLFLAVFIVFLWPFRIFYRSARYWMALVLARIFTTPLTKVHFKDFFIADQLTSLSIVFKVFCNAVLCFNENRFAVKEAKVNFDAKKEWFFPLIVSLPLLWRFLQCIRRFYNAKKAFPNLVNALKYFVGLLAIFFDLMKAHKGSGFSGIFVVVQVIATLFSFTWDLRMDWGLGNRNSANVFLRDRLMYPCKTFYYFAIVSNLFLRFCWVLSLASSTIHNSILTPVILGVLEIYRRCQWNLIRLENEHLNNCENYRSVLQVPLPQFYDQINEDDNGNGNGDNNGNPKP